MTSCGRFATMTKPIVESCPKKPIRLPGRIAPKPATRRVWKESFSAPYPPLPLCMPKIKRVKARPHPRMQLETNELTFERERDG